MDDNMKRLKTKLAMKRTRVLKRYEAYDMKREVRDLGISTPPNLMYLNSIVGWAAKGVDTLADRLVFSKFVNDNFGLNEIYRANNPDILFDSAVVSALIASCAFIYIFPDGDGNPRLQVIDGGNATGEIDTLTNLLTEGYAVLERDDMLRPVQEAYFTPNETVYFANGKEVDRYSHGVGYPLLVPVIFRPDAKRPFGHSRISRAALSYIDTAVRTIKRSEISAEFYSYPQKYAMGVSENLELDRWKASMATMLTITKDEDGDHPIVGQFTQASQEPHLEQLKMMAALYAGEVGLTLDDLGFPSDQPSSAESIKAAHDNLRLTGRKAQRCFGTGFLNAGFIAACLRDKTAYNRDEVAKTLPRWKPLFEPDAAAISLIGDGIIKVNNSIPNYFSPERLDDLLGFDSELID